MRKIVILLFLTGICFGTAGQITNLDGTVYEIETPYTTEQLREIQFIQSNDVMYLVHPDVAPQKLSRYDHNNWTIEDVGWNKGPLLDENTNTALTITPPAAVSDTNGGTAYADSTHTSVYIGARCFDDLISSGHGWISSAGSVTNQWVRIQYDEGKTITRARIYPATQKIYSIRNVRHCKIEGSNNGTDWTKISATAWRGRCSAYSSDEIEISKIANYTDFAEVDLDNSTSYTYYRLYMYDNWGGATYMQCNEIEFFQTGSVTFTASSDLWDEGHIGSIWKITQKSDNTYTSGSLASASSSAQVTIEGDYLLTLDGTWVGLATLEKSDDEGASWEPVYPKLNGDAANIDFAGNEPDTGYVYRVTMTSRTSGSCKYTLTAYNSNVSGYIKITSFVDANEVTAEIITPLANTTATSKWCEGAWSDYRGWPRAICLYQNRLVLAGSAYIPNGVWLSRSGEYENMEASSLDNGAIVYEVGSAKQNPILWLQDKSGIIAGTSGSIIRIFSQSNTSTLTPASIGSERQTEAGSCSLQAQLSGDSIIYVDRNNRKVFDMVYDLQSDGFVSPDLTILAEHITDPNILEAAVQSRPDTVLWFIKGDGDIAALTYNREQSVAAWSNIITDGDFESVACIPGDSEDQIWVSVKRTIDTNTVRYIEQFQPQDWGTDSNDCWFVDSGLSYSGAATGTITGLSHLEGKEVQIFYDGNSFQEQTVASGQVVLDSNVTVTACIAGLPFTSTLQTLPIELNLSTGSTAGYKKKIYEIVGCFYRSMYGQYGLTGQFTDPTMYDIPFDSWPDTTLGTDEHFTGQIRLPVDGGWDDEVRIKILQEEPYPLNVTGIITKIEISEN